MSGADPFRVAVLAVPLLALAYQLWRVLTLGTHPDFTLPLAGIAVAAVICAVAFTRWQTRQWRMIGGVVAAGALAAPFIS